MEDKVIYEVLRVINGIPIFLEAHLKRMKNSFQLINEEFTLSYEETVNKINNLIKSENKLNGNIKITYGINEKVLRIFFIEHSYPTEDMYKDGVSTILYFGERKNPNAKIINDAFRENVNREIKDKGAYEAILVDKNGYITEGSRSNIFMVKDNILMTSPTKAVLPGVTRGEIISLAKNIGIEIEEIEYKYSDIDKLGGMFISGTSPKVLPIKKVDNMDLDPNNRIIRKLMKEYNNQIKKYLEENDL
ncbi:MULTISPECIES: aminotransferase class IV [unclassified Clostridium]|uniref:aminotransferase class IV n=1 Tax=unclassified Clostridium TaxID=2614128 RepID=UPI0002976829|nr:MULTISPECIES: aminotransferase class IV [unclassified Clostridium]EKQ51159.1 MAG: branched-chain amino acid aminotransferase/4-amino-4-deoxychorismate lyase [Clostridium sp. Maddingley MBC34-26]